MSATSKWRREARARRRLTAEDRRDRSLQEIDFQRQVVQLAEIFGWDHVHWRKARTAQGWRTPASGTMAAGWPDLTLVRVSDRRLIFVELKRELGDPSDDQVRVLTVLAALEISPATAARAGDEADTIVPSIEVYVWRPSDLDRIAVILR